VTPTSALGTPESAPIRHAQSRLGLTLLRTAALALIAGLTLTGNGLLGSGRVAAADHPALVAVALGVEAVLVLGWVMLDRLGDSRPQLPASPLFALLVLLGAIAGLVSTIPIAKGMVGFTIMAAVAAGADLETGPASAVVVTGVLAIEVSSLAFGFTTGDAVGWPLAVIVGVLVGRNRRDVRIQRAQSAALVAQVQQTRAEEQRSATLVERARIAREIHDLLAHSLGALGIQLEAAEALLIDRADVEQSIRLVSQARRLAASGLAETREAIEALRTDTPPLPESFADLVGRSRGLYRQEAELFITGVVRPVTAETSVALTRIADEALINAAKHAPTARVAVQLDYDTGKITVTVTDTPAPSSPSGPRKPPAAVEATGGYGLVGMRERLLLIGGTLTAGPEGPGWTVRAQVPT
jgi:signal transduction histidine kinase